MSKMRDRAKQYEDRLPQSLKGNIMAKTASIIKNQTQIGISEMSIVWCLFFLYLISPIDFLPEALLGPIGILDDVYVLGMSIQYTLASFTRVVDSSSQIRNQLSSIVNKFGEQKDEVQSKSSKSVDFQQNKQTNGIQKCSNITNKSNLQIYLPNQRQISKQDKLSQNLYKPQGQQKIKVEGSINIDTNNENKNKYKTQFSNLVKFLQQRKLTQYAIDLFVEQNIMFEDLKDLTEADIQKMRLKIGDEKKCLRFIREMGIM